MIPTGTQTIQVTADPEQHLKFTEDSEDLSSPECTTNLLASRDKGRPPHLPSSLSACSSNPHTYMRAAQPRNPGRDVKEGEQWFWAAVAPSLPPLPGFPLPSPLVPVSRPACSTQLQRFSEWLSHLPAETAIRGPLPWRNRCGSPLCNICALCPRPF